jgi:hypothetical protein
MNEVRLPVVMFIVRCILVRRQIPVRWWFDVDSNKDDYLFFAPSLCLWPMFWSLPLE